MPKNEAKGKQAELKNMERQGPGDLDDTVLTPKSSATSLSYFPHLQVIVHNKY